MIIFRKYLICILIGIFPIAMFDVGFNDVKFWIFIIALNIAIVIRDGAILDGQRNWQNDLFTT